MPYANPEAKKLAQRARYLRCRETLSAYFAQHRAAIKADPERFEKSRLWRREHKRKLRRALGCGNASDGVERTLSALAVANAGQAWRWWLSVLASTDWLDRYWAAHPMPWRDPRLNDADVYRLRYRLDAVFAARERQRQSRRRFLNPEYAAIWSTDGTRWWRAAESDDGSLTDEFMRALQAETHCAYCLEPIGEDLHLDHVMPLSHGGLHSADNLVACCGACNLRKSATMPLAWLLANPHRGSGRISRVPLAGFAGG